MLPLFGACTREATFPRPKLEFLCYLALFLALGCWGERRSLIVVKLTCAVRRYLHLGMKRIKPGTCSQRCKNMQSEETHGKASNPRICASVMMAHSVQSKRKPHRGVVSCPHDCYRLLRRVLRWLMWSDARQRG